jgi:hypothetical protein
VSDVAETRTVPPACWWQVAGLWLFITPLDDPLLRAELHRVTVDWRPSHIRVQVAGNCAGVQWSTSRPDTHDFMTTDGAPL